MAEGKKGFVLYTDLIHTVQKMPMDKRGELLTIILEYVNDLNPKTDDLIVDLVFEPIKRQMKRDLLKYEDRADRSRENGKLGGRPKKTQKNPKEPSGLIENPDEPRKPDTVTDTDTVTVTDTVTEKVINIKKVVKTPTQKVLDFDESKHIPELVAGYKKFIQFIDETIHVKNIPSQITIENYKKLCDEHDRDKLWQKITELDNWLDDPNIPKGKKKKKSLTHLMQNTWLKNGY
jgi:hypothetical protein